MAEEEEKEMAWVAAAVASQCVLRSRMVNSTTAATDATAGGEARDTERGDAAVPSPSLTH